jgi:predicted ATPase
MKGVWPDSFVEEGNVTLQISLLRKVLGDDGSEHRYICNIPGRGYQFVAAVSKVRPNAPPEDGESVPGAVATGLALSQATAGYPATPCNGNTPPKGGTTNGSTSPEGIPLAATSLATGTTNGGATNRGTTSRNNLPLQPTRLIGRDEDVKRIKALLNDARMVTLMGAPGSGKTRLGIRTARELAAEFPDGVFLVELAPIRDPDLVASAIAHALGLQETGTTPVVEMLKGHLDAKRMLLLLDNFEHLLPAALLIAELLASACEFKVLATSRAALDIRWEQQYLVEPLAVPGIAPGVAQTVSLRPHESNANHAQAKAYATLASLRQCPSVALFLQRARAVKSDFDLRAENAAAVAEICRRLGGLPLAIELITAHVKTLSPVKMLDRIEQDPGLLAGARLDAPVRHQTMQMAIESSHELLTEEEKMLFRRLAVFVGGFSLEAAEAVCGGEDGSRLDVAGALRGLINKSMVGQTDAGEEPRFTMLEVIREFGLERLEASGEADATHRRHAQFFCALAERNERPRQKGETLDRMLAVLDTEIGNLRAAMGWSRDNGDPGTVLRIASAMRRFWAMRGSHEEGSRWLNFLPSEGPRVREDLRGRAIGAACSLARLRGEYNRATALIEDGLNLARDTGNQEHTSDLLMCLGDTFISQGCHEKAIEVLEEGLALSRERKDHWFVAGFLCDIGVGAFLAGQYDRGVASLAESLELHRQFGDKSGTARSLVNLASALIDQGNYKGALKHHTEALALVGELWHIPLIMPILQNSAQLSCAAGEYERGVRMLAAGEVGRQIFAIPPVSASDQVGVELALEKARRELEPATFGKAWEEGSRMTLKEAMNLAREEADLTLNRGGERPEVDAVSHGLEDGP